MDLKFYIHNEGETYYVHRTQMLKVTEILVLFITVDVVKV